ncbi:minichromosome maintenance domain-containing protein 2 isoform X2 [Lissotriton helveticus]
MSLTPQVARLREAALVYLDRSGGLQKFVEDCKAYDESRQSYAVYRFLIYVNPCDIAELDSTLGNLILHEPRKAVHIFQSVCAVSINTLSLIEQLKTENQINVVLKLTHLPSLPSYFLSLLEFPIDYTSQRFYMLEGIVVAMTVVTKYTQGARFLCSEENCPYSQGYQYIRVHTPGATESATIRQDFSCDLCASPLKEDMKSRVLGDKQIVEVIDATALHAFQGSCRNNPELRVQSFTVFLRDELSSAMILGDRCKIIGIPTCLQNYSHVSFSIEANSIHHCTPPGPFSISESMKHLHLLTMRSPWSFTAIIANVFASQLVPVGTYNTLKLCLLLSLVQTCNEDRKSATYVDCLVLTSDTLLINRLLNYSISLVPRGIRHLPSCEIFATVTKDEHGTGTASIQACSALLAKGGVCFVGDLMSQRKDKLELLQSVLESRSTTLFIPGKKYGEEMDQQLSFPVECSFWSFVDMGPSTRRHLYKDIDIIGKMDLGLVPANLADAFGVLVHCNESSTLYPIIPLVHHTLSKALIPVGPPSEASLQLTSQDFEKLIAFAKELHVELSPEAEKLIHGYYLASRRVRTDSMNSSKLSTSALKNL